MQLASVMLPYEKDIFFFKEIHYFYQSQIIIKSENEAQRPCINYLQ